VLDGRWAEGRLERRSNRLACMPANLFVGGMSGSPIVSPAGEAIGVVPVAMLSPVLADALPAGLLR
jgi:hypothetical protein